MTTATEHRWLFDAPGWEHRILDGHFPVDLDPVQTYLNRTRVAAAWEFMGELRLHDVPSQPYMLEATAPHLLSWIEIIAGSLTRRDDVLVQRVQESLLCVAKKNSKTTLASLMMLTLMAISPRPRAEFLFLAPRIDTADLAFQAAAGGILASEALRKRFHLKDHTKTIEDRASGCKLRIKNFELKSVTGSKPAATLIDEVWLLDPLESHRVYAQVMGGTASIPEATILLTSTHSDKAPTGFWKDKLNEYRDIRDGKLDTPGRLPAIFEAPSKLLGDIQNADEKRIKTVIRCSNPGLGYSVREDFLLGEFDKAKRTGGQQLAIFASQHLNAESTFTGTGDASWPGARFWSHGDAAFSLDDLLEDAERIVVGLDSGGLSDLTAIVILGEDSDGTWRSWCHCWATEIALDSQKSIRADLELFVSQGDLSIVEPGADVAGAAALVERIVEDHDRKLTAIGLDPANNAADFADAFEEVGIDEERIFAVPQGIKLMTAYQALERRLADGRLKHCTQPVLQYCVMNAMLSPKGVLSKASSPRKIDALVALATAAKTMIDGPGYGGFDAFACVG